MIFERLKNSFNLLRKKGWRCLLHCRSWSLSLWWRFWEKQDCPLQERKTRQSRLQSWIWIWIFDNLSRKPIWSWNSTRAKVYLPCPGRITGETLCSDEEKLWLCSRCEDPIWDGIDTKKFYCIKCQTKHNTEDAQFRCNEAEHGFDLVKYPTQRFEYLLSLIRVSDNINILIFKEPDVEISILTNAFANHLGKKDQNVKNDVEISDTQVITHPFQMGKYTINFIDTPGKTIH